MKLSQPISILAAGRLPQGRFGGALAGQGAVALGEAAVRALLQDPALPRPTRLSWGMARSHTQGMNPGRTIAVRAGLGHQVVGTTLNMACGSGMGAIFQAAQALLLGEPGPVVAGGSEAMSDNPHLIPNLRWGFRLGHRPLPDVMHQDGLLCPLTGLLMGETVEHLVKARGITRAQADHYALESHRRSASADFSAEHLPHPLLDHDECIRPEASLAELEALAPIFSPGGQVTAGNASALSDGAAALLLAREGGSESLGRILGWTEVALDPMEMGAAPIPAIRTLLDQCGLQLRDIDLWEINEAFAAQVLCCAEALDLPMDRLNIAGGAISLGHPIGASGARIVVAILHRLRQRGGGLGIATLGIGGGLGQAVLVEVR
ncbi:MAG: acetyl-CoA acetyltransferase [Holophagaceae bacterium]|nr:acetyl-CoA acetyltransferase [Holophagaceae bacterium]